MSRENKKCHIVLVILTVLGLSGMRDGQAFWFLPRAETSIHASNESESTARIAYQIERTTGVMRIDARLDESVWQTAAEIPLPFEVSPGDNTPASVATTCRVTYDDNNLYFAFTASDPNPKEIRAYITDRDDNEGQDRIAFVIDPFNDLRRAFDFTVTALGVQDDSVFDEQDRSWDDSWDAIWHSAGRITESGFIVEAAIPFKSLRFPGTPEVQTWGFYAQRIRPRSERTEMRSMRMDWSNSCQLCQANLLIGIQKVAAGKNVQITPSFTSSRTDDRPAFPDGNLQNDNFSGDFGLDLSYGVTSDLTLNATLNPDFSQVEADVAQLDVNNQFALFFPEKRPFFLEGADLFATPLRAVFTRTIANPSFGTKLSGKAGSNVFGLLLARDEINNLLLPGSQGSSSTSVDSEVTTLIGRYRRDVGDASTLGALYTGREGRGYYNRVGGLDGFIRLSNPLSARFQALHSMTRYPAAVVEEFGQPSDGFEGQAFRAQLNYNTRDWNVSSFYQSFDPDFRSDAGFMTRVDIRQFDFRGTKHFWADQANWFTRFGVTSGFGRREDFSGQVLDQFFFGSFEYQGPLQSSFGLNPDRFRTFFQGQTFTIDRLNSWARIQPSGNVRFEFFGQFGEVVDFANVREAGLFLVNPWMKIRLGRHVNFTLDHRLQRLTTAGEEIFEANLTQLRAFYNFNTRTFLRAIVQFRHTARNPELYTEEVDRVSRNLFTQFLFSYKVNPQSVFFLGYSDNRLGFTTEDYSSIPLTQANRTFFMKLSYAWRP